MKTKITEWFSKTDDNDFKPLLTEIEERPLNPLGHAIYWIVLFLIVTVLLWLNIGKTDIVISGRGIVIPAGEEIEIQNLNGGIIKEMYVQTGDKVEQGEKLCEIVPSDGEPELEIENLQQERKIYDAQLSQAEIRLKNASDREKRLREVRDIITIKEYEEAKELVNVLEKEVSRLQAAILGINNREIQTIKRRQIITAPVSGYVNKVYKKVKGTAMPGDVLLTLTPINTELQIKTKIRNEDIGFLKTGMPARIKLDTYNFQKYGMIEGEIEIISSNSEREVQSGHEYIVYIKPKGKFLPSQNKEMKIGMLATVEIQAGERRLIEFFVYPLLKEIKEGMQVR